jgi:HPt (histidine-containing phosphotransfer) domain-containing protein
MSGFAAIDKVQSGKTYDVIFMDHMMPKMDGIETTKKIRELGYKGVIVALTANALAGNDEMFRQNGFDSFISKPIDIKHLNSALNKFIRDRHPDEAVKYKAEAITHVKPSVNPKLLEVFSRDAQKAVITLRETVKNGDIKLFTTTAHAMKSALANVGENEKSSFAFELEKAGKNSDTKYINANTERFIDALENLVKSFAPKEDNDSQAPDVQEDSAYLTQELTLIKQACESYDDTAAYAAFDRIKEKQWKTQTAAMIEEIRDMLFLHSDFDAAAARASKMLDVNSQEKVF